MTEAGELPKTLERHCCSGKSCTTTLSLDSMDARVAPGQEPIPTLYRYLRESNDDQFGPGWSTAESLLAWVEESAAEDAAEDAWRRQAAEGIQ